MSLSTRLGFLSGFLSTFLITFLYLIDKTLLVDGFERLTLFFLVGAILYVMLILAGAGNESTKSN